MTTSDPKSTAPGDANPFRHPIWWYSTSLAILVLGLAALFGWGRLQDMVTLLLRGELWKQDPEAFFPTLVGLVVVCLQFQQTVAWLARRYAKVTGEYLTFWTALKAVTVGALTGSARVVLHGVPAVVRPGDDLMTAVIRAVGSAGMGAVGVLLVATGRGSTPSVLFIGLISLLTGLSGYCLERARPCASDTWLRRQSRRLFKPRYSWRPADYEGVGRRWFLAACLLSVTWFLILIVLLG